VIDVIDAMVADITTLDAAELYRKALVAPSAS
jgi:hypothetical protein